MNNRHKNTTVNESTADQEFTVGNSDSGAAVNENVVKVKPLERYLNERIDREVDNIVDTVEDRIAKAIMTAIDSVITPKIELAIRSINASCGRDATSVMVSSQRGKNIGKTAPFGNVSKRIDTLHVLNTKDETRNKIPGEVSELWVQDTHFDQQPHTHHNSTSY